MQRANSDTPASEGSADINQNTSCISGLINLPIPTNSCRSLRLETYHEQSNHAHIRLKSNLENSTAHFSTLSKKIQDLEQFVEKLQSVSDTCNARLAEHGVSMLQIHDFLKAPSDLHAYCSPANDIINIMNKQQLHNHII